MNTILIIFIVIMAVSTRLVAHPYNFTPVLACALLAGIYSKNKFGILVPIAIMVISDEFLDSYSYITYVSLFSVYLIAYCFIYSAKMKNVILGSIVGSFMFFIISNFLVWCGDFGYYVIGNPFSYEDNFMGIWNCYIQGLPFFRNTLLSTVFFSVTAHAIYILMYEKYEILKSNK